MTGCPKCGSIELRAHGSRVHVAFVKQWRWFGPLVPRITPVAVDASCANCLYAFTVRESGISEAPLQTAHDQLREIQAGLKAAKATQGTGRNSSDEDKPQARPMQARPAPDPRVKRR